VAVGISYNLNTPFLSPAIKYFDFGKKIALVTNPESKVL